MLPYRPCILQARMQGGKCLSTELHRSIQFGTRKTRFVSLVFYWLKENAPESDCKKRQAIFGRGKRHMEKIPCVTCTGNNATSTFQAHIPQNQQDAICQLAYTVRSP